MMFALHEECNYRHRCVTDEVYATFYTGMLSFFTMLVSFATGLSKHVSSCSFALD